MKRQKYGFILLLVLSLILSQTLPFTYGNTNEVNFKDVPSGHWAESVIEEMANRGIMAGLPGDLFAPDKTMTREEFSVILCRAFGLSPSYPSTPTFSDVSASRWSYGYIEAAKVLLTGYFPNYGKATFNPSGPAFREDVAVAISKAMAFQSPNEDAIAYLDAKFVDADQISPGLRQDVFKVVYYRLMSGTTPYTFEPEGVITRASAAALFSKVLKSSYVDATKEILLVATVPTVVNVAEVKIIGKTNPGNRVYIGDENDEDIIIGGNEVTVENGVFTAVYTLMGGEGTYNFKIKAVTPTGKGKEIKYLVKYETVGPEIVFDKIPSVSENPTVTLTGKVKDPQGSDLKFYVNDKAHSLSFWDKSFSVKLDLTAGKNVIKFEAVNDLGKSTQVTKEIIYNTQSPTLKIDPYQNTVVDKKFFITGSVVDPSTKDFKDTQLVINNKSVRIGYNGTFKYEASLVEGINTFTVVLKSKAGLQVSEVVAVTLNFGSPVLVFDNWMEKTASKTFEVHGSLADSYDYIYKLFVNNEFATNVFTSSGKGSFSVPLKLKEGLNTFEFSVKNSLGKETRISKTIEVVSSAPEILITSPAQSEVAKYTLTGKVLDQNDSYEKIILKVNGRPIAKLFYDNSFSYDIQLVEGLNSIVIEATNASNKSSVVTKEVVFGINPPVLQVTVPQVVTNENLKLTGSVVSAYDGQDLSLSINGEAVNLIYGAFEYNKVLIKGVNTFTFVTKGNKSGKTQTTTYTVNFAPSKPTLFVNAPDTSATNTTQISGNAFDENGEVTLTVNGVKVVPNESGNWNYTLNLIPGSNTLEVVVINKYGEMTVFTKTIMMQ